MGENLNFFSPLGENLNFFSPLGENLNFFSPLGENLDFFSPLGFDTRRTSDHETPKIKLYSVRALKCHLNDKNLIHGRVTATISGFSPQIFETYFHLRRQFIDSPYEFHIWADDSNKGNTDRRLVGAHGIVKSLNQENTY